MKRAKSLLARVHNKCSGLTLIRVIAMQEGRAKGNIPSKKPAAFLHKKIKLQGDSFKLFVATFRLHQLIWDITLISSL